jgi:hypothetical protein
MHAIYQGNNLEGIRSSSYENEPWRFFTEYGRKEANSGLIK